MASMEIVTTTPNNGTPFHNRDVREWSRLDSISGVLERARLETDHWSATTATASHNYNKVVDSRARTNADGNLQQQARRKFEVFQSQVPGGRIQVIKTQTVSSSRWSSSELTQNVHTPATKDNDTTTQSSSFGDLKLSLNPLDLTSEKAKASVGRSVGRRPPSRSRIRDDIHARNAPTKNTSSSNISASNLHATATTNLHRVSRLCHQIHNSAVKETFGGKFTTCAQTIRAALPIDERESGDGVEITEIADQEEPTTTTIRHTNLTRTKSTSSEDFFEKRKSLEDLDDLEQLQSWRRTSKLRRSLQYPKQKETPSSKPPDLPVASGSVRKIREDLETGRRLSTALRGNSIVDLDSLDQILKSISNSSISSTQSEVARTNDIDGTEVVITAKKQQKRDSFVTVESIQAVRDKLRRTTSPTTTKEEEKTPGEVQKDDDDDGIVTDKPVTLQQLHEYEPASTIMADAPKKHISGTGSLESRNKSNNYGTKHDDWYMRRKSYGFEQMHQGNNSTLRNKNRNESSTDSGICRSTEIVTPPSATKVNVNDSFDINDVIRNDNVTNVKKYAMIFENKSETKPRKESNEIKRHSIAVDESKYINTNQRPQDKRTSLVLNDANDDTKRSNKKVEFCKTEVHFAADSGRVNIVETDEKPPPTQRFRRRRRNSGPSEDYPQNTNGLPVQHFGDSSYEKFLFGDTNVEEASNGIYETADAVEVGNVTVTTNGNYELDDEPQKDGCNENEAPRGILKNKPIKPKPFLLGAARTNGWSHHHDQQWPDVEEEQHPIWKSTATVTVKNTNIRNHHDEPAAEFQKLRQQLRPTSIARRLDEHVPSIGDTPKIDQIKRYSPLMNTAGSPRILSPPVDDGGKPWSVADRIKQVEDLQWTENKGYSTKVNFGNGEATVVENRHTTWPRKDEFKEVNKRNLLNKGLVVRIGQDHGESLALSNHKVSAKTMTNKSSGATTTTKITIDLTPSPTRTSNATDFKFPRVQVPVFKSPSLIMNAFHPQVPHLDDLKRLYDDVDVHSDVDSEADKEVHRILMNSSDDLDRDHHEPSVLSGSWSKMRAFKNVSSYHDHALIAKDPVKSDFSRYKLNKINDQIEKDLKYLNQEVKNLNLSNATNTSLKSLNSPLNTCSEKLSSPFLVGQSRSRTNSLSSDNESHPHRFPMQQSVLRQPKKSEMAYFGVDTKNSIKHATKLTEKPDLLQFEVTPDRKKSKFATSTPLYENLQNKPKTKTFDSSILDELTKAADEILLAVNGYTDEELHDDETRTRRRNDKLDTITENKSWKQQKTTSVTNQLSSVCQRSERHKSSNSSIDESRKTYTQKKEEPRSTFTRKKQTVNESTHLKASTKARRLQRASSREALLQSHGSSSEDLPTHVEITRKPRLVKRTKTTQLTVTNGPEMKKPTQSSRKTDEVAHRTNKHSIERSSRNLPEIRHRTAVSTIRSTADKQAATSSQKAKLKNDELKKRTSHNANNASSKREATTKVAQPSKSVDRSRQRGKEVGRHTSMFNQNKKKSSTTRNDSVTPTTTTTQN